MLNDPPADHPIRLFVSLPGSDVPVGSARSMADVPQLLRAVADAWQRRLDVINSNAEHFDAESPCTLSAAGWPECRAMCGDCYSPGS